MLIEVRDTAWKTPTYGLILVYVAITPLFAILLCCYKQMKALFFLEFVYLQNTFLCVPKNVYS